MKSFIKISGFLLLGVFLLQGCKENPASSKGSTIQTPKFTSAALGMEISYSVYLPPSYNSGGDFPVLYLLHGFGGNYMDWPSNGMRATMDQEIENGNSEEMIVIMPDGMDAFYINGYDQRNLAYEDFFINELIPEVESKYSISDVREHRGIAGLSMGGYGATYHGFKYQDMFSFTFSMSGAVEIGGGTASIRDIMNSKTTAQLADLPEYHMDCGQQDFLYQNNVSFSQFLTSKGVGHEFIVRPGAHDWNFWNASLFTVLDRYSALLRD